MNEMLEEVKRQFTMLPRPGTKAADLTDRDKVALAYAAGVECEIVTEFEHGRHLMRMQTKQLVGFADGPDGKLIIGIGPKQPGTVIKLED